MTLIELLEYASDQIKLGETKDQIETHLVLCMGTSFETAKLITDSLNQDGSYRRIKMGVGGSYTEWVDED